MYSNTLILLLAVLLRIVANPLANVFQKKLTVSGVSALTVNFLTYFILGAACLIFSVRLDWHTTNAEYYVYSVIMGLLGALGNLYLVKALQMGDLSVLGPINAYKAVISMLIGLFVLNEIPSVLGLAGVGLIIFGSYFVLNTTEDGFSWALFKRKEIQYRIWAMILTATEAIFVKKVILVSSVTQAFFSWCWFGALFSFVLLLFNKIPLKAEMQKLNLRAVTYIWLLVCCIGIAQFSTGFIFDRMPVGYALSLFQLSVLVNIFLGYRIFKEEDILKKLIGAIIMIAGSVLIILF
ncbi:EamA family transporter [Emticicia sp. 21SJ11W-3]|uniref:EamA family transporter n=1 Tax=Emticicia sp. 21SJ11W-3 TaxID=2916755 RepID=UPI00209F9681|nr:EamA family transporter [Emticicia sp. 21SJ11W-3]UTA69141.1 EamA family transporter [Emticicia sp. 21SJ11W-3]